VQRLRFATHPVAMSLVLASTIFLWMPFGIGYYGWPWEIPAARIAMMMFALGVPIYAASGCIVAAQPKPSPLRLGIAACTLLVGLYGALAMLHWLRVYVGPRYISSSSSQSTDSCRMAFYLTADRAGEPK